MKIKSKVLNSISDVRKFRDQKTGVEQSRKQVTLACQMDDGELLSCVMYSDDVELPKSGSFVVLDVYRYESENPLMGSVTLRGFDLVK